MNEEGTFPNYFYSRAPLSQKVELLNLKTNNKSKLYWMLSLNTDPQREGQTLPHSTLGPYNDNDSEMLDCCELEDVYEINPTKSGKFITTFYVPNSLHSVLIGPRGTKLKELQDYTNTLIKVPKRNEEPIIKVMGPSERSVASARTQITLLLLTQREKMKITHFVSIPICSDDIKTNFFKFKQEILDGPSTRGVDETIFQIVEKLHLTLVTLVLLDDKEIEEASHLLNQLQANMQKIFKNKKPLIVLQGLEIMNDDPADVNVLYGKVRLDSKEDMDSLQEAADEILDTFFKKGLVKKQYDSVKLHVTLMNSIFRKDNEDSKDGRISKRASFDASYIIDKYGNYYFGKTVVDKILLSVRFTTSSSGFYQTAASISL